MNVVAARNAEIPSLVQIIAALKNQQNPSALPPLPTDLSAAMPWATPPGFALVPVAEARIPGKNSYCRSSSGKRS
jgi:hypothetical protein